MKYQDFLEDGSGVNENNTECPHCGAELEIVSSPHYYDSVLGVKCTCCSYRTDFPDSYHY